LLFTYEMLQPGFAPKCFFSHAAALTWRKNMFWERIFFYDLQLAVQVSPSTSVEWCTHEKGAL
jgi:hypothetical protein